MNELTTPASMQRAIDRAFDRLNDFLAVQRPLGTNVNAEAPINLLQESVGIDLGARQLIADRVGELSYPNLTPAVLLGIIVGLTAAELEIARRSPSIG